MANPNGKKMRNKKFPSLILSSVHIVIDEYSNLNQTRIKVQPQADSHVEPNKCLLSNSKSRLQRAIFCTQALVSVKNIYHIPHIIILGIWYIFFTDTSACDSAICYDLVYGV